MGKEHLEWKSLGREKLFTCPIFDIYGIDRASTDGRNGRFIEMESKDWIVAIPWYRRDDGVPCFIMEDQFRHGNAKVTREFPGGLVEKGEPSLEAAKRELLEETGIKGDFSLLGEVCPNAAFMSNRQSFYLVENLEKVSSQRLDENEQIDVVEVPVETFISQMGSGMYDNGTMMMAMGLFLREAEKRPELREVRK